MKKGYLLLISLFQLVYGLEHVEYIGLHQEQHQNPLEIAHVTLHFDRMPEIKKMEPIKDADGFIHERYIFVDVAFNEVCTKLLAALPREHDLYRVACAELSLPHKGVQVDLYYDPASILCSMDEINVITKQKAIVFRLINKKLLDNLQINERPLIEVAQGKMSFRLLATV